jgi:hypothetical protein
MVILAIKVGRGEKYWLLLIGAYLLIQTACFTKESTMMMIPISLAWWLIAWIGRRRHSPSAKFAENYAHRITLISILAGGIYLLARYIFFASKIIGGGQSSSFSFEGSQILSGLVRWGGWLLRDFTWLVPMTLVVLVWCLIQRLCPKSRLWMFAGVWMAAWLGLYIPWYFGAEYYLLPFAAGAAILAGVLLVEIFEIIREPRKAWITTGYVTLGLTCLLMLLTLTNSATDASVQLAQDAANTRVMEYVAENAPQGSTVLVNIQLANEYIEQMEFLLNYEYGRTDLQFDEYQAQDLSELAKQYPAVYVLLAEMQNQPKLTVRMGFIEDTLNIWNSILLPKLDSWKKAFQVSRDPAVLTIDFPRLLCPVVSRESYCAPDGRLVDYKNFHYGWTVYTNK